MIIIQENRTFDNLFHGYPGADTANTGKDHLGHTVTLVPVPLNGRGDWSHSAASFKTAYDHGRMDGFDLVATHGTPPTNYSYVRPQDTSVYWQLASAYTLGDRMFQSNGGPSFPAHQYLIAGQTGSSSNPARVPWGCDNSKPRCYDYSTLGDNLDAAGVSWRDYASGTNLSSPSTFSPWLAYDSIRHIRYGPDWSPSRISIPETNVLSDIQQGTLAQVSWVTPSCANSDHHACKGAKKTYGPAWVSAIVNAIGSSQYWSNTAIIIVWDDWGGLYDHVAPVQSYGDGLGFRVPLLIVSPYAKHGYVSHVDHEFGSILRFVELNFGASSLFQRDAHSDDLSDCFDFSQTLRPFVRVKSPPFQPSTDLESPDDDM